MIHNDIINVKNALKTSYNIGVMTSFVFKILT